MKNDFGIGAQTRPTVFLILGPGESGKDTAGDELCRLSKLPKDSTSEAFCRRLGRKRDDLARWLGGKWRIVLGEWMAAYNVLDGSRCRLYREMYEGDGCRIFTGIRRFGELIAFLEWLDGRAEAVVWWIDASRRDLSPDLSMRITLEGIQGYPYDDISCMVIDSNAGVEELRAEVRQAWREFQAREEGADGTRAEA